MEKHLKQRPKKKAFQKEEIERLRNKAIKKLKSKLLPNGNIIKIILIGSSIKNTFGEYEQPGFRGSLFSDFDFIIFTKDNYKIPKWLDKEPNGKPFPQDDLNLAYRNKKFIENKYDIEVFFIKQKTLEDSKIKKLGEKAGVPMIQKSKIKHLIIYQK